MPTLEQCVGNPEMFPVLSRWDYFNHAGVSPWARPVVEAVEKFVGSFGLDCFLTDAWFNLADQVRSLCAKLVNASFDEVMVVRNTSDAIAMVASAIDWKKGDRIVLPEAEYPSNVYPWMDAAQRHGCELVMVKEHVGADGRSFTSEDELIAAASAPGTTVLAVSHVQWATGQLIDLAKLGAFCRSRGVLLAVDVIQSAGVVPIDVVKMNADFLFAGGHKWLMSPPGGGFMYVRKELIGGMNSPLVGWLSVVDPMDWRIKFTRRPDAGRFETGTHALASLAGMKASLELMMEVGIDHINRQVASLGRQLEAGAIKKGYQIATPEKGPYSGSLCFTGGPLGVEEMVKFLRTNHKIEICTRMGRLRFSPHFYNSAEQVERMIAALP
jgi:cysteine desulfurase / selenocysteine lyase